MWLESETRQAHFDLGTFAQVDSRRFVIRRDPEDAAKAIERYGDMALSGDAIARVPLAFEMGKRVLEADGFIAAAAWLLKGDQLVDLQMPVFGDQATKRLTMNTLALRVKMLDADGFLFLSEAWSAPAPSAEDLETGNFVPARRHPDKAEAIQVLAVTRDHRSAAMTAPFQRTDEGIVVSEPVFEAQPGSIHVLGPILKVWGIEVPPPYPQNDDDPRLPGEHGTGESSDGRSSV